MSRIIAGALLLSLVACSTPQPMDLVRKVLDRDKSACNCSTTGAGYSCSCESLREACGPSVDGH